MRRRRRLDNMIKLLYNFIIKLWLGSKRGEIMFKTVVREILHYIINTEMQKLIKQANDTNDLHRKTILQTEVVRLKALSDKLDDAK